MSAPTDSYHTIEDEPSSSYIHSAQHEEDSSELAALPRDSMDPTLMEEEEEVSPQEVLAEMSLAWQNELAAPTLLPNRFDLVYCLQEQVDSLEEATTDKKNRGKISTTMHRLEQLRVSYMLTDYSRRRLAKIESNPGVYINEHNASVAAGKKPLLSEQELVYAEFYQAAEARLMDSQFLCKLPSLMQSIPQPELNLSHERCLVKVLESDLDPITVADLTDSTQNLLIDVAKDTIHCVPFTSVREHLENDMMMLL